VGRYRGYVEAIEISRQAKLPLHIAHLSTAFSIPQPHADYLDEAAAQATLDLLDDARAKGLDVTFDTIPCGSSIAGERPLTGDFLNSRNAALDWLNELGKDGLVESLRKPAFRKRLHDLYDAGRIKIGMVHPRADPYWMDCFRIVECANEAYEGQTVGAIAARRNTTALDAIFDILVEDPDTTWVQFMDRRMLPAAIPVFLNHADAMPCTDIVSALPAQLPDEGGASLFGISPIMYGLYPHYFRTYVFEQGVLGLEEAVKRATSLPAQRFGLTDRGTLRVGAFADIVLFDPETIRMTGDFRDPVQAPEGIEYVLVNGQVVYKDMAHTGAKPGKVLKRQ
jgi:N-acyl-D-amino-acid deacylase